MSLKYVVLSIAARPNGDVKKMNQYFPKLEKKKRKNTEAVNKLSSVFIIGKNLFSPNKIRLQV